MNMIIGPNGTGKSTIVCAIALGLGGSPNLLGRAKNIQEFVKTGEDEATIAIELKKVNERNVVIQRSFKKSSNSTSWKVNGTKASLWNRKCLFFIHHVPQAKAQHTRTWWVWFTVLVFKSITSGKLNTTVPTYTQLFSQSILTSRQSSWICRGTEFDVCLRLSKPFIGLVDALTTIGKDTIRRGRDETLWDAKETDWLERDSKELAEGKSDLQRS